MLLVKIVLRRTQFTPQLEYQTSFCQIDGKLDHGANIDLIKR